MMKGDVLETAKRIVKKVAEEIMENDWNTYINMNDLIKKEIDKGTATT